MNSHEGEKKSMQHDRALTYGWPRVDDSILKGLSDSEREELRSLEETIIQGESVALEDIFDGCKHQGMYAKTFRQLRRDARQTVDRFKTDPSAAPGRSTQFRLAMAAIAESVTTHKLKLMADYYYAQWGEDIALLAGKEGDMLNRSGCIVLLMPIAASFFCWIFLVLL